MRFVVNTRARLIYPSVKEAGKAFYPEETIFAMSQLLKRSLGWEFYDPARHTWVPAHVVRSPYLRRFEKKHPDVKLPYKNPLKKNP